MKRRAFITLLGGAAAAWPLARAQQGERVRRIGLFTNLAADDAEAQARNAAFLQALQQLGWTSGNNVRIDFRFGAGDAERNRRYASELVAFAPDVIVATGSPVVEPLRQVTRSVPIIFRSEEHTSELQSLRHLVCRLLLEKKKKKKTGRIKRNKIYNRTTSSRM